MYQIEFIREGITLSADGTQTLLDVMRRGGLHPDAPCGGRGKCGKCRVYPEGGAGVLACQTRPDGDMRIDTKERQRGERILTEGLSSSHALRPAVRQLEIAMEKCPPGRSTSDWARFEEALCRASGRQEPYQADPQIASGLGELYRRTGGRLFVLTFRDRVLEVSDRRMKVYLAAFDIGTTTVAAYLLEGETGKEAAVTSRMNPQAQYGADVINRANYALEHSAGEVTGCIRETVDQMLEELARKAGAAAEDIRGVSIAGNTCMHHLFLGISTDSLVHAPYNPAIAQPLVLRAEDYGIRAGRGAPLLMLPNIAGFVGADTVAALVATDLAGQKDWTLLVDIGTNGEMVLGRDHDLAACSTAAGPAFEGAGITCGMRGSEGAISRVRWTGEGWEVETVGDAPPVGICGSGLLDLAAQLLISGQMDESGQLMLKKDPGAWTLLLADEAHSGSGRPVVLTQKDIRQLQLAKAAIASGIYLLAERQKIRVDQIRQVWLAGAFGSFLSPKSACAIGLIPAELSGRIKAVGNAAGEGAKAVLLDEEKWELAERVSRETDFVELAAMPQFQDRFVDELMFPEGREAAEGGIDGRITEE